MKKISHQYLTLLRHCSAHYCENAYIIYRLYSFSVLINFHNTYYIVNIFKLGLLIHFFII